MPDGSCLTLKVMSLVHVAQCMYALVVIFQSLVYMAGYPPTCFSCICRSGKSRPNYRGQYRWSAGGSRWPLTLASRPNEAILAPSLCANVRLDVPLLVQASFPSKRCHCSLWKSAMYTVSETTWLGSCQCYDLHAWENAPCTACIKNVKKCWLLYWLHDRSLGLSKTKHPQSLTGAATPMSTFQFRSSHWSWQETIDRNCPGNWALNAKRVFAGTLGLGSLLRFITPGNSRQISELRYL